VLDNRYRIADTRVKDRETLTHPDSDMTEPRHSLPKEFTEGTKEQRLQALRKNKERETAEWLRRENEKVARSS
jgi:hypothetical protein